ncbi:SAM-dependent methyltransferase [Alkalimarinus alittae]|uniref:Nicotianamine synthase n=1 Tax=Alkalimarinus alittae TaxID=2961619 RepID=A0ABY6N3G4_9ALTE|nr:hypothetical protein [Alkalimarinus alittae]UZE96653.1 hypothetical protein NKI27_02560 [Alkalimarinus alittae]
MLSTQHYKHRLSDITDAILDTNRSIESLHAVLDDFASLCSEITAITPDATFDAWADDSFLESGVAINPQAAAFCIKDYQRSVMFIRGVDSAIDAAKKRFPAARLKILYAGCGPFATLLLPLLVKVKSRELDIYLLDIHQQSLDSVNVLLTTLDLLDHQVTLIQGDACVYQHDEHLHIIIAEVMQKALEQEPQVAATANLAPQLCKNGIFIPQKIEVQLCLAHWEDEKEQYNCVGFVADEAFIKYGLRYPLGTLLTLKASTVGKLMGAAVFNENSSMLEANLATIQLPNINAIEQYDVLMLTRIQVFETCILGDYDAEITLPHKCYEFSSLRAGSSYMASYQFGRYPRFNFTAC